MSWTFLTVLIVIVAGAAAYLFLNFRKLIANVRPGAGANASDADAEAANVGASTLIIGTWVIIFALVGVAAILAWSFGQTGAAGTPGPWRTFGLMVLIGLASAAAGALLGFLFGIPRTLDPASRVVVANAAAEGGPAASSQAALAANTNLERVSDWLTTLLIGATLVQAGKVVDWVGSLGTTFSGDVTIATLTPLIVVYYSALGFLGIYLVTRLYLTFALRQTLALLTGASGPRISSMKIPPGDHGAAYNPVAIQASGGTAPLRWASHGLPAGLSLDPGTGTISGTPGAAATSKFVVVVTDSSSPPLSDSVEIEIVVR